MVRTVELPDDKCCVYILQCSDSTLEIGITGDMEQRMEGYHGLNVNAGRECTKLVYYRCFPDTLTAIGFKLLLKQLSPASVRRLIHEYKSSQQQVSKI